MRTPLKIILSCVALGLSSASMCSNIPPPPLSVENICTGNIVLLGVVRKVYVSREVYKCSANESPSCNKIRYETEVLRILKANKSAKKIISGSLVVSDEWSADRRTPVFEGVSRRIGREFIVYGRLVPSKGTENSLQGQLIPVSWYSGDELQAFSKLCAESA